MLNATSDWCKRPVRKHQSSIWHYFLRFVDPDVKYQSRKNKHRGEARNHFRKSISEISALYSQVENVQQLEKSFTFPDTFFWTRILGPYRWKERARNSSQTIPWAMLVVVKEALSHYRHAGQQASDRSLPRAFSHIAAVFTHVLRHVHSSANVSRSFCCSLLA